MPKNKIGGKGFKRGKKDTLKKELPLRIDGETEYAKINTLLGNGRAQVIILDSGESKLGHIRGSMYKKVWINKNDIVLVSLRDFENTKCDIIFKYDDDQVRYLSRHENINIQADIKNNQDQNENDLIEFNVIEEIESKIEEIESDVDDEFIDFI